MYPTIDQNSYIVNYYKTSKKKKTIKFKKKSLQNASVIIFFKMYLIRYLFNKFAWLHIWNTLKVQ